MISKREGRLVLAVEECWLVVFGVGASAFNGIIYIYL